MFARRASARSLSITGFLVLTILSGCDGAETTGSGGKGGDGGTGGATSSGGAGGSGGTGGMVAPETTEPSPDTQAIWTQIADYAKSWTVLGASTPAPSMSHANMYVVTYHNDVVGDAIANNTLPLPDGAILVKDNFMSPDDAMPMAVTVMAKQAGAWYWIRATPDGKVFVGPDQKPMEGDVAMCAGCHSGAADNDSVFSHDFTP